MELALSGCGRKVPSFIRNAEALPKGWGARPKASPSRSAQQPGSRRRGRLGVFVRGEGAGCQGRAIPFIFNWKPAGPDI